MCRTGAFPSTKELAGLWYTEANVDRLPISSAGREVGCQWQLSFVPLQTTYTNTPQRLMPQCLSELTCAFMFGTPLPCQTSEHQLWTACVGSEVQGMPPMFIHLAYSILSQPLCSLVLTMCFAQNTHFKHRPNYG